MVAGATERSGVILTVRKKFDGMMPQRAGEVGGAIALLGRHGLAINDSAQKYTLRTLPGQFSGLHLVSIMFAAFQPIGCLGRFHISVDLLLLQWHNRLGMAFQAIGNGLPVVTFKPQV